MQRTDAVVSLEKLSAGNDLSDIERKRQERNSDMEKQKTMIYRGFDTIHEGFNRMAGNFDVEHQCHIQHKSAQHNGDVHFGILTLGNPIREQQQYDGRSSYQHSNGLNRL